MIRTTLVQFGRVYVQMSLMKTLIFQLSQICGYIAIPIAPCSINRARLIILIYTGSILFPRYKPFKEYGPTKKSKTFTNNRMLSMSTNRSSPNKHLQHYIRNNAG